MKTVATVPERRIRPGWLARLLLDDLHRHPGAAAAIAATFALGAALFGAQRLLRASEAAVMGPVQRPRAAVLAYLRDDVAPPTAQALERALGGLPGVEEVTRVSPAEALARMRRELGVHARVLDGAEDGLLPASLEVSLLGASDGAGRIDGDLADLRARADELGRRLREIDGVLDVDVVPVAAAAPATGAAARWSSPSWPLRVWFAALGAAPVAAALAAALAGVMALRRARRRDEIRLMLALGFTRAAALLPAVASAVAAAVVGAALGLVALRVGWGSGRSGAGWPAGVSGAVAFLSPRDCALALALALGAGALAGYLGARVSDPADAG